MHNRIPALYEELVVTALAVVPFSVPREKPFSISSGIDRYDTFIDPTTKQLEVRHSFEGESLVTIWAQGAVITYHGQAFVEESLFEYLGVLLKYQQGLLKVQNDLKVSV